MSKRIWNKPKHLLKDWERYIESIEAHPFLTYNSFAKWKGCSFYTVKAYLKRWPEVKAQVKADQVDKVLRMSIRDPKIANIVKFYLSSKHLWVEKKESEVTQKQSVTYYLPEKDKQA